jgi:hypothetical protein
MLSTSSHQNKIETSHTGGIDHTTMPLAAHWLVATAITNSIKINHQSKFQSKRALPVSVPQRKIGAL